MKKVQIQKIASLLGDGIAALNSGDKEVFLKKTEEITNELTAAEAEAPDDDAAPAPVKTEEEIQNAIDTAVLSAVQVELKKYADLYVSAADVKTLFEDLIKGVSDRMASVETLAKTTSDTLTSLSTTPAGSKQDPIDIKNTGSSPLDGVASRL